MALCTLVKASIGKKELMGLTGLALTGFVFVHMLGNLLMFAGPEAYNMYGHGITSSSIYYLIELGLLAVFLIHLGLGLRLTFENRGARNTQYKFPSNGLKAAPVASKMMIHQGMVILIFTISHLITFRFGTVYTVEYNGVVVRDLYVLMQEVFASSIYVAGYVLAMVVVGFHLSHGVHSSLQSLGLGHPSYTPKIKFVSLVVAGLVAGGFIAQPLYFFFIQN
jgi:succinate dehydrogenase / fumarate reductase cytochrome b subunit